MLHHYFKVLVCVLFINTPLLAKESEKNNVKSNANNPVQILEESACASVGYFDVAYGSHPEQNYDIYLPTISSSITPKVLIVIHGGGWRSGDKEGIRPLVNQLRERYPEYALVNMNYRLATETQYAFPDQFLDIGLLIEHLTYLSDSYNISPEFGIIGKSAGGHLALMYDAVYDATDQVKFVTSIAGPTNFNDPAYTNHPMYDEVYELLVDPTVYDPETALDFLSPIYNISDETSPTLVFHGEKDRIVPVSNANDFSEELKINRISIKLTLFPRHHLADWTTEDWKSIKNKIGEYLDHFLPLSN